MEVVIPVPSLDFNFDSNCSTPYVSAPSSPQRFGNFYSSAPASPTRASAFFREFNNLSFTNRSIKTGGSSSVIPFDWEEVPGKPKSNAGDDFEFNFSGQLERASLSAEELFDGGIIRPLKPPPRLQLVTRLDDSVTRKSPISSPRSPRSPISQGKKMFREAFSPRPKGGEHERGRERVSGSSFSNSGRRGTRSLSPFRVSEFALEQQQQQQQQQEQQKQNTKPPSLNSKPSTSSASSSSSSSFMGYRKWRLKDFLLFRSASEGRATDKDHLRKYAALSKKNEDVKNASFRSTDSSGSVSSSVSSSRRRGPVSAHELHYKVNRAVSEDLRKKTFLPYKQGLLGCLGFNPAVNGLAKGIGSLARG